MPVDWIKILEETDKLSRLSEQQRRWRCTALLRCGRILEAESLWANAPTAWKSMPEGQQVWIDILLSQGQQREADRRLLQLAPHYQTGEVSKSWLFLARRVLAPTPELSAILLRHCEQGHGPSPAPILADGEWKRILRLPDHEHRFDTHFGYIEWLIKKNLPHELVPALNRCIDLCPLNFNSLNRLTRVLADHDQHAWILEKGIQLLTRHTRDIGNLWRYWHRSMPRHLRPKLLEFFEDHNRRHPDHEVDEFLAEIIVRT